MDELPKSLDQRRNPSSDPYVSSLLIDGNPANLLSLTVLLDGSGLDLVKAHSGEKAFKVKFSSHVIKHLSKEDRAIELVVK